MADASDNRPAASGSQLKGLVPDLSKVDRGSLDVAKGEQPLFGSALAHGAMRAATDRVVAVVTPALPERARVLVTSDAELAASDGVYWSVDRGLEQLIAAARELLEEAAAQRIVGVPEVAAAVAAAVPGVLSLLAAHRSLTSAQISVGDIAAVAATAGALRNARADVALTHDGFRLLPAGGIRDRLTALNGLREALESEKFTQDEKRQRATDELAPVRATVESPPTDATQEQLDLVRRQVDGYERVLTDLAAKLMRLDAVCHAIDNFTAALSAVPEGSSRSPLTLALMRQQLHAAGDDGFTHALLIRAEGGSATQAIDDRPLWFKDKFSVVAVASVTYMLIETSGSNVLAAGTASGSAALHGDIGRQIKMDASPAL